MQYPPDQPSQLPPEQPRNLPPYVKWIGLALTAIVVIVIVASAIFNPPAGSTDTVSAAPTVASVPTDTPTPKPTYTPIILSPVATETSPPVIALAFSGNGNKKTGFFDVPDNWTISYTCYGFPDGTDGLMSVSVYGPGATIIDANSVNATCSTKGYTDSTEEHSGGTVYLDINATGRWTITIHPHP
jgi:hypothetical protein